MAIRRVRLLSSNQCKGDKSPEKLANSGKEEDKPMSSGETSAKEKLSNLLKEMVEDGPLLKSNEERIELARPKRLKKDKISKVIVDGVSTEVLGSKMLEATKNVAESLGGDVKETESVLLKKLLSSKGSNNLSEVIGGMTIDHGEISKPSEKPEKKWSQVRQEQGKLGRPIRSTFDGRRQPRSSRGAPTRVDIFGGSLLGIFVEDKVKKDEIPMSKSPLSLWDKFERREIKLSTLHPPRNYFQQMILWTEQGKLWNFPIDNEQGLEEEKKVFFTEHVFLEKHLQPWCPKKGPVRHFMELVCVGLSKNPHLTVSEKKAHILWYADYFDGKKDILKEIGALPD